MNTGNNDEHELSALLEETADKVADDHYYLAWESLAELGLSESDGPIPLIVWSAVAQAIADISGFRVVLEATTLAPVDARPNNYRAVGHVEVACAEPTLFVRLEGE